MKTIKMVISTLLLIILYNDICSGQKISIDTVEVEGFLYTFVSEDDLKNEDNAIDLMFGYYFIEAVNCKKCLKSKKNFELDRKQKSLYLLQFGASFSALNELFFENKLEYIYYDISFFPALDDFKYRYKKTLYKCTPVSAKCLKVSMSEKELIRIIPFGQYNFNTKTTDVYIINEIFK